VVLFVGTHERQLDDKGRLALPASFRSHLGEHCYLVFGDNNCIRVVRSEDFEVMAAELSAKVARGEVSKQYQRVVASTATLVQFDGQGRVKVDEKLRDYADLATESKVVVIGTFDEIEIWSPGRFARVQQVGTSQLAGEL
jgi:MraZ protein